MTNVKNSFFNAAHLFWLVTVHAVRWNSLIPYLQLTSK